MLVASPPTGQEPTSPVKTRPELAPPPGLAADRPLPFTTLLRQMLAVPQWQGVLVLLALEGAIYAMDDATSAELTVGVFYLLPIALAALRFGTWGGLLGALISGALSYAVDKRYHHAFSHPGYLYWDAAVHVTFFAAFATMTGELRHSYQKIASMARLDVLTGLANRRRFYELAAYELTRAHRTRDPMSLMLIDVDNFKRLNDERGHAEGDRALEMVGVHLKKLRRTDVACRVGGDEFVALMPDTPAAAARVVVEKLHEELTASAQAAGWPVGFSVGVVTFLAPPAQVEEMVHRADEAMYTVKRGAKNGVAYAVFGEPSPPLP